MLTPSIERATPAAGPAEAARPAARPALITAAGVTTHGELAERSAEVATRLGSTRRLVLVPIERTVESIATYLGALRGGHAVMLTSPDPDHVARLSAAYDPDVTTGETWREARRGTRHALHPDLALLLSTSGSTGSPRLVRLSRENLLANADQITASLRLRPDDRALTTLPLHYCYGLSVLHSHLRIGASVALTDGSVVDPCTWEFARRAAITSFAGVPHTFDLLDAAGRTPDLPSLRLVTVAGGRLAPERLRAWADRGIAHGWDLVAMYGQTEATARLATLAPERIATHGHTLGDPVPGVQFRIDPVPEAAPGTGELVATGPNIMLGYADSPADLARGRDLSELRTGDLVRRHDDSSLAWVGRRTRILKAAGLRIDLDDLERRCAEASVAADAPRAVAVDDGLHLFTTATHPEADRRRAAQCSGLPSHRITVHAVPEIPHTDRGKPDYPAMQRLARATDLPAREAAGPDAVAIVRHLLDRPEAGPRDSFVSLGGDSLSFVEVQIHLADAGFDLPPDWHHRPLGDLTTHPADLGARPPRRGVPVEASVLLRVGAIVAIVASHANLIAMAGGAHVLLILAGHQLGRFAGSAPHARERLVTGLRTAARIAAPAAVWIGGVALVAGTYDPATALLLNGVVGSDTWTDQWQFWFLEVLVWTHVGLALLLGVPLLHRCWERHRWPTALTLLGATLALRYAWVGVEAGPTERYTPGVVLWCLALGLAAQTAPDSRARWLLSAIAIVAPIGFFGDPQREAIVAAGALVLLWAPAVRLPRAVAHGLGAIASASLFIYLTHWQVYPHWEDTNPWLAVTASFAVGWVAYRLWSAGTRQAGRALQTGTRHAVPVTARPTRSPSAGGVPTTRTG